MVIFIKSKIRLVCYLAMTLDGFLFKVFHYSLLYDLTKKLIVRFRLSSYWQQIGPGRH